MIRRASGGIAVLVMGIGMLVGPLSAPSSASPCPRGTVWSPELRQCIVIGPASPAVADATARVR